MTYEQNSYDNHERKPKRNIPWAGVVLVFFGLAIILNETDVFRRLNFLELWPVLLIAWGAIRMQDTSANRFLPSIAILAGILLISDNLDILPYYVSDNYFAIFLIILGAYIILQHKDLVEGVRDGDSNDFIDITNVFGGSKQVVESQNFKGGQIVSAFGGPEIDLRRADIGEDDAVINVTVVFGGIDLYIPSEWDVVLKVVPIFGGTDDTRIQRNSDDSVGAKKVIIKGVILFGGMDIKS